MVHIINKRVLSVYKMSNTKKPEGEYTLTIPMSNNQSKGNLEFYTYTEGMLKKLDVLVEDNLYTMVTENIDYIIISEGAIKSADNNAYIEGCTNIIFFGIVSIISVVVSIIMIIRRKKLIIAAIGILFFVCSTVGVIILLKENATEDSVGVAFINHENIVKSQEVEKYEPEILTGEAWWENYENSKSYTLVDDGRMIIDIGIDENNNPNNSGFCVEIYDNAGYYFTTTTNGDAWYAGTDGSMSGLREPITLTPGEVIRVIVTREGKKYTFEYYDKATGECLLRITAVENGAFSSIINLRIMAQVGTYKVKMVEITQ